MTETYYIYNAYQINPSNLQSLFNDYSQSFGFNKIINLVKNKKTSDKIIYTILYNHHQTSKPLINKNNINCQYARAKYQASKIFETLSPIIKTEKKQISTYLDLGSGNGLIAQEVGKKLNTFTPNCIDIKSTEFQNIGECEFQTYNGYELPYKDNTFDLITTNHVLHHVHELDLLLYDISRVLKPDGLLYIKEHNKNSEIIDLIHVQHILPAIVSGYNYSQFAKSYYGNYMTINELKTVMKKHGFNPVFKDVIIYGATHSYNQVFSKIDSDDLLAPVKSKIKNMKCIMPNHWH